MRTSGTIGAALAAAALTLGLATPAKAAADVESGCSSSAGSTYICAFSVNSTYAGEGGLYSGSGGDYTVNSIGANGYTIKVRVYADNGNVIDYDSSANGRRLTYGIDHIRVWLVGYLLGPSVTVA